MTERSTKILVIDDDRAVCEIVKAAFKDVSNYTVEARVTASLGLEMFTKETPDVVLLDLHLPETNGFELFNKFAAIDSRVPVIFATMDSSSEVVIQAMRIGAFDYLKKPLQMDRLRRMVASAVASRRAAEGPVALTVGISTNSDYFIGSSLNMVEVFKSIGRVANQKVPVLIRGESGSGKELVARALVDHSSRADKPFVSINCAAIPDALLESELFGHEKGSFTGADKKRIGRFEHCNGGTIFLDEIGDMSPLVQGKVLRLLQEQVFERVGGSELVRTDVRIIAATHQPLEEMVEVGRFRNDLLYRLNGYTIELPPLRDRREDLPTLIEYFLRRAKKDMERPDLNGLTQDALDVLHNYEWPGNVRELQSVLRQGLLNCVGSVITSECFPEFVTDRIAQLMSNGGDSKLSSLPMESNSTALTDKNCLNEAFEAFSVETLVQRLFEAGSHNVYSEVIGEVERILFTKVLQLTEGNQSKASEVLGITRGKIRDRIAAFGIKLDTTVSVGS